MGARGFRTTAARSILTIFGYSADHPSGNGAVPVCPPMPLVIVFWVPGIGPFAPVARLMSRLAGFYVPFLFMTVPIAVLFRLGELLGDSVTVSIGGFGQWLLAIVTPLIAVIAPFVLLWW